MKKYVILMLAVILLSGSYNIMSAKNTSSDKDFKTFYKSFVAAWQKKDKTWLSQNSFERIRVFPNIGLAYTMPDNNIADEDIKDGFVSKSVYFSKYVPFENDNIFKRKMNILNFGMSDKLFSKKNCWASKDIRNTGLFSDLFKFLPKETRFVAVRYTDSNGVYEYGFIFALIDSKYHFIGEWDCSGD